MTPLGSNRDRHANLGEGEIGPDGLAAFLSEPRFDGLPVDLRGARARPARRVEREDVENAIALRERGSPRAADRQTRPGERLRSHGAPQTTLRRREFLARTAALAGATASTGPPASCSPRPRSPSARASPPRATSRSTTSSS